MMLVFPPVFDWKDDKMPDSFKPRCHLFYGARTFDIEDGAVKFEGMKEKSDTLPEVEGDSDDDEASNAKTSGAKQEASTANGKSDGGSQPAANSTKASSNGGAKRDGSSAKRDTNGTAAEEDSIAADVKRQRRG